MVLEEHLVRTPMVSYQDARNQFYETQSGHSGSWVDSERKTLLSELSLTNSNKSNPELLFILFNNQGYTAGSLSERWYKYLGDLGFTGTLRERQKQFFITKKTEGFITA